MTAPNLIERTAMAVQYAMTFALADAFALAMRLPHAEQGDHLFAYLRIAPVMAEQAFAVCVAKHGDAAELAFYSKPVIGCIRNETALATQRALNGDCRGLEVFAVGEDGLLHHHPELVPHTTFSREHRLHWEQDPESNYKGSRAETELRKLRDRLRREKLPWSRDMCKTMGVTPRRARA